MIKLLSTTLLLALLACGQTLTAATQLTPLTTFGTNGDGTIKPGDFGYPFLTGDGSRYQRSMAYNPTTGHLIIVNRFPTGSETINIIDAFTGAEIGALDLSARTFGGSSAFPYNAIAIGDDGAIYVGNLTTSGTLIQYNLYRWANEASPQTLVFGPANPGDTTSGNSRWGDTLAVRGSGMTTEVLVASQGTLAAILKPTDPGMASFTSTTLHASVPSGAMGVTVAFGAGNTFYAKSASAGGEALYLMTYDAVAGTATPARIYGLTSFPGRVGAIGVQIASNLLAAIEMTPGTAADRARLYDITDTNNSPVFLDRKDVTAWTNANALFAGSIVFGSTNVYAINSDNGLAAFTLTNGIPSPSAPVIFGDPTSRLAQISSNTTFSVGADGTAPLTYQWFKDSTPRGGATNATLTITNSQTTDNGSYFAVVTNQYGAATSAVAVLNVIPNYGNLVQFDPFPYTPGTPLANQGGWLLKSAAENGVIEAGNLSVPGLNPSFGNRYTYTGNNSVRFIFSPQQTNGSIYFSFAMRIDNIGTSTGSETMAGFAQGTSTSFPYKLNIVGDGVGNSYSLGVYKNSGTTSGAMATNVFTASDVVFVVGRMVFRPDTTTDDTCDLWLNPPPSTFGESLPPTPSVADAGAGRADLPFTDGFMWRFAGGYPKRTVDEWRLGYSWSDVTPPAAPSLMVTPSGANVTLYWSTNVPPSFKLQSRATLDDQDGWQPVSTPSVISGSNNTVTVPAPGMRLFRLSKI